MGEVNTPEFVEYSKNVVSNASTLAEALKEKGHKLASDGTDNHLVLWDVRPHGLTGSKIEKVCDAVSISLNRNAVHGDASALSPGGVRIGAPAMTTRGCTVEDFKTIGGYLDRCCTIALAIQKETGKKLVDFEKPRGQRGHQAAQGRGGGVGHQVRFSRDLSPYGVPIQSPLFLRIVHWLGL